MLKFLSCKSTTTTSSTVKEMRMGMVDGIESGSLSSSVIQDLSQQNIDEVDRQVPPKQAEVSTAQNSIEFRNIQFARSKNNPDNMVVLITDKHTGELVRTIPADEFIQHAREHEKTLLGKIVDQRR